MLPSESYEKSESLKMEAEELDSISLPEGALEVSWAAIMLSAWMLSVGLGGAGTGGRPLLEEVSMRRVLTSVKSTDSKLDGGLPLEVLGEVGFDWFGEVMMLDQKQFRGTREARSVFRGDRRFEVWSLKFLLRQIGYFGRRVCRWKF